MLAAALNDKTANASQSISAATCRICLGDKDDDPINNPFVTPCQCAGTMKFLLIYFIFLFKKIRYLNKIYFYYKI